MKLVHDTEKNVWNFETEEMRGFIQPAGDRHGNPQAYWNGCGASEV